VPHDEEWRILAEEAAQENDLQKLIEIIEALNRALNQQGTAQERTAVRTIPS